jgi:succinate dehydrogenase cytochrome b556 subunit
MWAAHRITGLILMVFFALHLFTLSAIFSGPLAYDQVFRSMEKPWIKIGEILLLWVVMFHSLNGCRLILFNLVPTLNHKRLAYSVPILSTFLALIGAPFVISL